MSPEGEGGDAAGLLDALEGRYTPLVVFFWGGMNGGKGPGGWEIVSQPAVSVVVIWHAAGAGSW
ncbi:MAG: hypothetical protein ABSG17_24235 [Spirochaetia bacterium]